MPNTAINKNTVNTNAKIAVLGGGIAGSIIALRLSELGINTTLLEQGPSLINGPPICHLHAGGSFYREISDEQCLKLLQQSIDTVRAFPQGVNIRPTVIAVPKSDPSSPLELLPRLEKLQQQYQALVNQDPSNQVLGEPRHYYQAFDRQQLQQLASQPLPSQPSTTEEWMIPVARGLDWDKVQLPLVVVQEYGLSGFRFAAIATLASERLTNCHVKTHTQVTAIQPLPANNEQATQHWQLSTTNTVTGAQENLSFDYLINACGFQSGQIDDMLAIKRERMVEFKAAYIAKWSSQGQWPEIVFHGERGTPQGMAQLTPYPDGYFQLHGMTQDITLFRDGLAASNPESAQPQLPAYLIKKIQMGWPEQAISQRTLGSIEHLSQYIPSFQSASVAAKPLFGAQQIPGSDASLRAADVSFEGHCYARTEIVKASSALAAADKILQHLDHNGLVNTNIEKHYLKQHHLPMCAGLGEQEVTSTAVDIAQQRAYPSALARLR